MSDNPYQTPAHPSGIPLPASVDPAVLKGIARWQRRMRFFLLVQIGWYATSQIILPRPPVREWPEIPPPGVFLFGVFYFLTWPSMGICTFQVVKRIKGSGPAAVWGILSLVPWGGVVVPMMVSRWATKILKAAGFKVSLFGVSPGEIQKEIDALR